MFRKILVAIALVTIIGVLVFGAVNRTLAKNTSENSGVGGHGRGNAQAIASSDISSEAHNQEYLGRGQGQGQRNGGRSAEGYGTGEGSSLPAATTGELSVEEIDALQYMREEEKLAHDVYAAMYTQWSLPVFQNISQSEQAHTEAVKVLLDRYEVTDPASGETGIFTDPDLQALYNELVARGSQSLAEALKVGAAIEEIDILDLQSRLAQTDNADIQHVFNNLLRGSNNHLQAFVSTLKNQIGETYQPQYLSTAAYQDIINTGTATGGNGKGNGNDRRGGQP